MIVSMRFGKYLIVLDIFTNCVFPSFLLTKRAFEEKISTLCFVLLHNVPIRGANCCNAMQKIGLELYVGVERLWALPMDAKVEV